MKVLEIAVGAVSAPTTFSLARISIRDLVPDQKSLLSNSGVGGGGQNFILTSGILEVGRCFGNGSLLGVTGKSSSRNSSSSHIADNFGVGNPQIYRLTAPTEKVLLGSIISAELTGRTCSKIPFFNDPLCSGSDDKPLLQKGVLVVHRA